MTEHTDGIREFVDAEYDHLYIYQVRPDQRVILEFNESEVVPSFA